MYSAREEFVSNALDADVDECIIWPFAVRKSSGYGAHSLRTNGTKRNVDAHRYTCELVHGAPFKGAEAAHRCGNKLCINPKHLYWATHTENMGDAREHESLKGGGRYRQRIFDNDIEAICRSSDSLLVLAARYGSDPSYIGRLKRRHSQGARAG